MDFRDSPQDAEFRAQARAAILAAAEGIGPEPATVEAKAERFRGFQAKLHEQGFAGMSWPQEFGGRGASLTEQAIFLQEYDAVSAPDRINQLGEGLAGPTIIDFGTDEQKRRYLPPILDGTEIWCQLFSEPGAGSDLAALDTKAERDGDGWRIQGQKVWTSRAQVSAFGMLLARTGGGPRHKGITYFVLPMDTPGVNIRPLRHMLGEAEFNEVFLDDVVLDDSYRIGEVDGGWKVAMATLAYERVALATGRVNVRKLVGELIDKVREEGEPDQATRRKLADLHARAQIHRINGLRALSSMEAGTPGPETSIGKLFAGPLAEDIADTALALDGLASQFEDAEGPSFWQRLAYQTRGTSIAGGTTFIQRNIVAERVLGLPRK